MWIFSLSVIVGLFLIEIKLIPRLKEDNKFKKWWRNNLFGIYEGSDF